MNASTLLSKVNVIHEDLGEESLVMDRNHGMFFLNQTAKYLWEHCNGRTISEVAGMLHEQCLEKDQLELSDIIKDCIGAFEELEQRGFVKIRK
ncbi:PqqD family protein [Paenibacillus sp. FSL K6-1217]|uniref:PqqD family protein n=1 Tax=Paenibacillus sp. FSL K6-1217 TaxID=2921466 RepID=UPI00324DC2FF